MDTHETSRETLQTQADDPPMHLPATRQDGGEAVIRVQMPAAPARSERIPVVSEIAVLDTARFQQMQAIATIMAECSMTPLGLLGEVKGQGDNATFHPFERRTQIANCFRVVNQAVRWGADPFAVADCASMIKGRLMWEGKLIAAVLEERYGVRLSYAIEGGGEAMAISVVGVDARTGEPMRNHKGELLEITGTVAQWKTTRGGSPWASAANWPRQLRYRGAREWCRAYKPSAILGVVTDDEAEELAERRVEMATIPMTPSRPEPERKSLSGGFPEPATRQVEQKGEVVGEPVHTTEKVEGDQGKVVEQPGAQNGAPAAASSTTAKPASTRGRLSKAAQEIRDRLIADGMSAEEATAKAREAAKSPEAAAAADASRAAEAGDPPAPEEPSRQAELDVGNGTTPEAQAIERHTATGGVQAAAPARATSEPAGGASSASPAATSGPAPSSSTPAASSAGPRGEGLRVYEEALVNAADWAGIKAALVALSKTPDWPQADPEGQRMARVDAYDRLQELFEDGVIEKFDVLQDVQAFRIWIATGPTEDAITDGFTVLRESAQFGAMSPQGKEAMTKVVAEARRDAKAAASR